MGNKPVVPENPSPSPAARPPRSKRSTLGSKGKAEISNPVQKPPITHRPYIDIGYQEDVEGMYVYLNIIVSLLESYVYSGIVAGVIEVCVVGFCELCREDAI